MATIRPLERADLPAVAGLLSRHLEASFGLHESFLAATLVEHPWADPEIPSLVAVDGDNGGAVVGFIGALVRRFRLGDRALRGVCCSHLVVAPESRPGATGALLLRRLFSGPQDLTWSDTANEVVLRMWRVFGGHADHLRACDWMLALHPGRWLGGVASSIVRRSVGRDRVPVEAVPYLAAGARLVRRAFPPLEPGVAGEAADAASIAEHAPAVSGHPRLRPDYDAAYLEHLFPLVERTIGGAVVHRLIRREGRPVGWYAYVDRPGGMSRVLHLAALDEELDAVFGELVAHVRDRGRAVLSGRLEPHLQDALRRRFAVLGLAQQPVIHARDPEVRDVLGSGSALITQLDGEWYVV